MNYELCEFILEIVLTSFILSNWGKYMFASRQSSMESTANSESLPQQRRSRRGQALAPPSDFPTYLRNPLPVPETKAVTKKTTAEDEERHIQFMKDGANMTFAELREDTIKMRAENICVICMDHARTRVVLPCCHLAYCEWCIAIITRCTLCRETIRGVVTVFR